MLDFEFVASLAALIAVVLCCIFSKMIRKIVIGALVIAVVVGTLHGALAESEFKEVYGEIVAVDIDTGEVYVKTDNGEIYIYFAEGIVKISRVYLLLFGDEVIDVVDISKLEAPFAGVSFFIYAKGGVHMGYHINEFGQKVFDEFSLKFWAEVLEQNRRNKYYGRTDMPWVHVDSLTVVARGSIYTFYPGIHKSDLGFGGTRFIFTSPDGTEYLTNNCWHNGDIENVPLTILEKFSEPWEMRCP